MERISASNPKWRYSPSAMLNVGCAVRGVFKSVLQSFDKADKQECVRRTCKTAFICIWDILLCMKTSVRRSWKLSIVFWDATSPASSKSEMDSTTSEELHTSSISLEANCTLSEDVKISSFSVWLHSRKFIFVDKVWIGSNISNI